MNYQAIWDGGFANRRAKILQCNATLDEKLAALNRVFYRMAKLYRN